MTYDVTKVKVFFNGVMLSGHAKDSVVSIEPNEDNVIPHIGSQGEVEFAINSNKTETATITLRNTSPSLYYLAEQARMNTEGSFQVVDMNNNIVETCDRAMILKTPGLIRKKEHEDVDVTIFLAHEPKQ